MEGIRIIKSCGKDLFIDRDAVMRQVGCSEDDPLYNDYIKEYEELLPEVLASLEPAAAVCFAEYPDDLSGTIAPGSAVMYMITLNTGFSNEKRAALAMASVSMPLT